MRIDQSQQELHPIRVVARRTGLTQDVLRAWERRYEAITPARSTGDRRMYSSADIERLTLLRRLTRLGRAIGQIARLPVDELRRLVREDESQSPLPPAGAPQNAAHPAPGTGDPATARSAGDRIEDCLEAVLALDAGRLHACLDRAYLSMGRIAALETVLLPLMRTIGERWRDGSLRVMHEHFVSSLARTLMESFSIGAEPVAGAPLLLAATPAGQMHELGALFSICAAAADGWRTLYLGPSLAAEEIAAAARQSGARVVALSFIYPADDARVGEELIRLRGMLPDEVAIVAGGGSAPAYDASLETIGAFRPAGLSEFRDFLAQLRSVPS